ncbi:MAG TPA: transcriptional repressor [Spirochaetota bacterium]|nr:transcriptional repressor [Spirochaetota bacterium]
MTQEKEVYYDYLSSKNIKHSKQRENILDVFLNAEEHLTIQELFEIVKKENKNVGVATVYRAMKIFCDAGLADEINLGDGNKRYEHKYNHKIHSHLICVKCGKLIEFCDERMEDIQSDVCSKFNFEPRDRRLQIYGVCEFCKDK